MFGVLTRDVITREEAFVHTLAPFYNADRYASTTAVEKRGQG